MPTIMQEGLSGISFAQDQATLVVTTNDLGEARISLASRSELHVISESTLLIALWADSQTTKNRTDSRKASIARVDGNVLRTLHRRCDDITSFTTSAGKKLSVFYMVITDVKADNGPYARIT